MQKKGFGLRAQITVLIISLVILVIIMISYSMMDLSMKLINRYLIDTEIITWKEILIENTELFGIMILPVIVSIGLGIISIFIFSSKIIKPVNYMIKKGQEIIESSGPLQPKEIRLNVHRHDEISLLADTLNQMGNGLFNASIVNRDLVSSKKYFLPFDKDDKVEKTAIVKRETNSLNFYGYFKAKYAVSREYFDLIDLSNNRYAVIKCSISGRGITTLLIMTQIKTTVHIFFNNLMKKNEMHKVGAGKEKIKYKPVVPKIDELMYSINEIIEALGFKGRYAALQIIYLDTVTGKTAFCNGGDNWVHIYKKSTGQLENKTIPEAPAVGIFPNDMVKMTSGFKLINYQMDPEDILVLYTDGIEETHRYFRNSEYEIFECSDSECLDSTDFTHGNGMSFEKFGVKRINDISFSVLNQGEYELVKYHNEAFKEEFNFDFSKCTGSLSEAILAVVSVERVFRLYNDPSADSSDIITIDENILEFLEKHFVQFDKYFHHRLDKEECSNYITYTHIKEDEQFTDLTLLGVKRKYLSEDIAESVPVNEEIEKPEVLEELEEIEIIDKHVVDDENLEELESVDD